MTSQLKQAFDSEVFRQQGHQLVDKLADYLQQALGRADFPVLPWREPAELRREWQEMIADPLPVSFGELTEKVLQQSIHLHHPRNCGHQVAPPAPITALAELFSALLNNSMAVYEVGPAGTAIEKAVLGWLAQRLGMAPGTDGILTSGGSLGNLTGLLAARRERGGGDAWEEGARGGLPMAVLVSEESHYSVARALKIMGLGSQGLIKLPVDECLQVRPELLESVLQPPGPMADRSSPSWPTPVPLPPGPTIRCRKSVHSPKKTASGSMSMPPTAGRPVFRPSIATWSRVLKMPIHWSLIFTR